MIRTWTNSTLGRGYALVGVLGVAAAYGVWIFTRSFPATAICGLVGAGFLLMGIMYFTARRPWVVKIDSFEVILVSPRPSLGKTLAVRMSELSHVERITSGGPEDARVEHFLCTATGERYEVSDNVPMSAEGVVAEIQKVRPEIRVVEISA